VRGFSRCAELAPAPHEVGSFLRAVRRHLFGAGATRDDAGAFDKLVAKSMVAVRVSVHERADPASGRDRGAIAIEHLTRVREVEERVHEKRLARIRDET
jgi:hypothetical protein